MEVNMITRVMFCLSLLLILFSCDAISIEITDNLQKQDIAPETQDSLFIINVKKRVCQIGNIEWVPKSPVPHFSSFFPQNIAVKGIPYSSVKELDKFVGFDVSFYTFMTAINNPRSVIYTENVGLPPYKGINCSTYYGTVCSAAVSYVLGLNFPWGTNMIGRIPYFIKSPNQSPIEIEEGDVILETGHESMVYEIERSAVTDSIEFVSIFESIGSGIRIIRYKTTDFIKRWNSKEAEVYKYVNRSNSLEYKPIPFFPVGDELYSPLIYNNDICPQLGDKAVYRKGEKVIINLLDNHFHQLKISRNDKVESSYDIHDNDVTLSSLNYGRYTVVAIDTLRNVSSDPVHFDVVDTNVSIEEDGNYLKVLFDSEYADPIFVTICNENGGKWNTIELSDFDKNIGFVVMSMPTNKSKYYCKVYFETNWGRVTNVPIKL